eukprot:s316_g8.t1
MPTDVWRQTFADQVQQALYEAYGTEIPSYLEDIASQVGVRHSSPRHGPAVRSRRSVASPRAQRTEKAEASPQRRTGSPRSGSGKGVGHRLYEEGIALRERRKAFIEEVMNLEQADLRSKAKELLSRGSRLYPDSLRSLGSTEERKERRYPGRICGFSPSRSLERSGTRRSLSPKSSRMEVKDDSSQTTQASSAALPTVSPAAAPTVAPTVESELELLKKQLGLLSMGAGMLLKKLEEAPVTPSGVPVATSSVEVDGSSPRSPISEEPNPSPSRSPSIRRASDSKVSFAQMPFIEQGSEPVTPVNALQQFGNSTATPSPVWGQVDYGARGVPGVPGVPALVRCPVVTVNSFVQVRPNNPVTQRVHRVQGVSPMTSV